jgi:hypothetical protein
MTNIAREYLYWELENNSLNVTIEDFTDLINTEGLFNGEFHDLGVRDLMTESIKAKSSCPDYFPGPVLTFGVNWYIAKFCDISAAKTRS